MIISMSIPSNIQVLLHSSQDRSHLEAKDQVTGVSPAICLLPNKIASPAATRLPWPWSHHWPSLSWQQMILCPHHGTNLSWQDTILIHRFLKIKLLLHDQFTNSSYASYCSYRSSKDSQLHFFLNKPRSIFNYRPSTITTSSVTGQDLKWRFECNCQCRSLQHSSSLQAREKALKSREMDR